MPRRKQWKLIPVAPPKNTPPVDLEACARALLALVADVSNKEGQDK
jgi:hypothetical protein